MAPSSACAYARGDSVSAPRRLRKTRSCIRGCGRVSVPSLFKGYLYPLCVPCLVCSVSKVLGVGLRSVFSYMYEPFYIYTTTFAKKTGACFSRAFPPRKKSFSRESAGLGASPRKQWPFWHTLPRRIFFRETSAHMMRVTAAEPQAVCAGDLPTYCTTAAHRP